MKLHCFGRKLFHSSPFFDSISTPFPKIKGCSVVPLNTLSKFNNAIETVSIIYSPIKFLQTFQTLNFFYW
ncbi:hypothetical protein ACJIZ3_010956 [Penstemon smallii]|uniref:Uncharacterized protein n=1 Tax=Penstemon smallii TaxID=265156 RepID=A0ABD3UHT1_9LAMI